MNIPLFNFKKTWMSRKDFPTYEDNEERVRADLQALHDEMKDYVNDHLATPLNEMTAEDIPLPGGSTVQAELDSIRSDMQGIVLGQVPDGSITTAKMQDGAVNNAKIAKGALRESVSAADMLSVASTTAASARIDTLSFHYFRALGIVLATGYVELTVAAAGTQDALLTFDDYLPYGVSGLFTPDPSFSMILREGTAAQPQIRFIATGVRESEIGLTRQVPIRGWYLCEGPVEEATT